MAHPTRSFALLALLVPAAALAQPSDVSRDRGELRRDRGETADDIRDLHWAETLQARFDESWSRHDWAAVRRIEDGVMRYFEQERRDARQELRHDSAKAERDAAEARRDRREGDRREQAEDVGKLHRDRAEAERDRAVLERLAGMERDFAGLRSLKDKSAMSRKRQIIIDLVVMARGELRHDARDGRQDHRQLREDAGDRR